MYISGRIYQTIGRAVTLRQSCVYIVKDLSDNWTCCHTETEFCISGKDLSDNWTCCHTETELCIYREGSTHTTEGAATLRQSCVYIGKDLSDNWTCCHTETELCIYPGRIYQTIGRAATLRQSCVYIREGSTQTTGRAATLRQSCRSKVLSHPVSILTPGQPVPELILERQAPGQGSRWNANDQVTGMTGPGKIPAEKSGIEPRVCHCRGGDTLTTGH